MMFAFGQPVTLVRRTITGQDAFGNDVYGQTTVALRGAFAPGPSSEMTQGQDTVITQPTVYLPAGTSVSPTDLVVVGDGDQYEVDGTPNEWVSPFTGWRPGIEVRLRRVTG